MDNIVWYGGIDMGQDVTVSLVPAGNPRAEKALAVLKLHSSRLYNCSLYFEAALSERWNKQEAKSSEKNVNLEVRVDIDCYKDCFSLMYSPSLQDFRNVKHCLGLFEVASNLEFEEGMDKALRYLSAVSWSWEEEEMIREFSSSSHHPAKRNGELRERLGFHMTKRKFQRKWCELLQNIVGVAMCHDAVVLQRLRSILTGICRGIGSTTSRDLAKNVVRIVSTGVRDMLMDLEKQCEVEDLCEVPHLVHKLTVVCRVLEILLDARVAGELVQYLAKDGEFADIIAQIKPSYFTHEMELYRLASEQACDLMRKILLIYEEVLAGHLLLRTEDRVALFKNWQVMFKCHISGDDYERAVKAGRSLFLTFPLEEQIDLLTPPEGICGKVIDADTFVMLMQRSWAAKELEHATAERTFSDEDEEDDDGDEEEEEEGIIR